MRTTSASILRTSGNTSACSGLVHANDAYTRPMISVSFFSPLYTVPEQAPSAQLTDESDLYFSISVHSAFCHQHFRLLIIFSHMKPYSVFLLWWNLLKAFCGQSFQILVRLRTRVEGLFERRRCFADFIVHFSTHKGHFLQQPKNGFFRPICQSCNKAGKKNKRRFLQDLVK